jgi:PAS domain S-box-containing protein
VPASFASHSTDPNSAATELFLHHPVPLWVYDRTTLAFLEANDAAIEQYGYSRAQFLRMRLVDMMLDITEADIRALLDNPGRRKAWRHSGVCRYRRADGSILHAEITAHDLTFAGRPAVAVAAYDVTTRVRAEHAARDAERRLTEAQELARIGSWRWDVRSDEVIWSDELFAIAGLLRDAGAPTFANQQPLFPPADWDRLSAAVDRTLSSGVPFELELDIRRPDGSNRSIVARGAAIFDSSGVPAMLHGTIQDVTERRVKDALLHAADERLRESETRYRELVENLDVIVVSLDRSGTIEYASPAIEQFGYDGDRLIGQPFAELVHPDDRDAVQIGLREIFGGSPLTREFRALDRSGRTRYVRCSIRAQFRVGHPATAIGVLSDISEQRIAQEQVRTAGRLEAVGRLAGGVAHDFNNLLVAITGFAELALGSVPEGGQLRDDLNEIVKAGHRAASLTSQLLAFSRRQALRPDSVGLNEVITSMEPMLRRLIGEDIDLVIHCEPAVPQVRIDTGHLEQVIMNLVVNARDAMPRGGTLRIETSSADFPAAELVDPLSPGNIAVIAVTDTGEGMDEATQAQIFEPFFTTKPPGLGTGLGLAMVYGFVTQSDGAISVRSAPGQGTTFRIALPQERVQGVVRNERTAAVAKGSETILVTEDEETVRVLVRRVLQGAGYRVLIAEGADCALDIIRSYAGSIDILLTDVVMPQTSGPELAERARHLRPDLPVLFMSGYSGREVHTRGLIDGSVALLQKPFSPARLSEAVRAALATAAA